MPIAFGKVVLALTSASSMHIPYRDSKLTRILQDRYDACVIWWEFSSGFEPCVGKLTPSLGGNCKTTLISTITPASVSYLESVNTLKFANRAKSVKVLGYFSAESDAKNVAVVNEDKNHKAMLSAYQAEIERLRKMLRDS